MRKSQVFILLLTVLMLSVPGKAARAEDVQIEYIRLGEGSSFAELPQLSGLADDQVMERLNSNIYGDGGYAQYEMILLSLTDAGSAGSGLQVKAEAKILYINQQSGLFTVKIEASGRIGPGRPGHRVTALMYDLSTGQKISASDIFNDPDEAGGVLNLMVEQFIEPQMSDYLIPDNLYPVPLDNLLADEAGITFYYDQSRFNTLSERSGAINFHYEKLIDLLRLGQGSVLGRFIEIKKTQDTVSSIEKTVSQGYLPGLPVFIGDQIDEVLIDFPPLFDSEAFPTGERFQLEDARFRDSWVISDGEQIIGIMSFRMDLYGLQTGKTLKDQVKKTLGEPVSVTDLEDDAALSYALVSGELYSYEFGEYTLHLNFDEQSVLRAVWLSQSTKE